MVSWVKRDAEITTFCTFGVSSGTAVGCQVDEIDEDAYEVMLTFGNGSDVGEVSLEMPDSLASVVVARLTEALAEVEAARKAQDAEAVECGSVVGGGVT